MNPLFVPSASDYQTTIEGELNLADLINIDEDGPSDVHASAPTSTPFDDGTPPSASQPPGTTQALPPHSPTGSSPFVARPDPASRSSFDLNSLWSPKGDASSQEHPSEIHDVPMHDGEADPLVSLGDTADDQDFDMFLGKDEEEQPATGTPPPPVDNSPEGLRAAFDALPKVWTGTVRLDTSVPRDRN